MGRPPKKLPPGVVRRGEYYRIWWIDSSGKRWFRSAGRDAREAGRQREELQRNARRSALGLEDELLQDLPILDLIGPYVASLRARCTAQHAHDTEYGIGAILDRIAAKRIGQLSVAIVEAARDSLAADGLANRTANRYASSLVAMLRWAARNGMIARCPVERIQKLPQTGKHQRRTRRRLTIEEAKRLQVAADELELAGKKGARSPLGDLVALALNTGLRLNEALQLTWRDWSGGEIHVRAEHAKNSRARSVPVTPSLNARLRERRRTAGKLLGRLPTQDDHIFLGPRTGRPMAGSGGGERAYRWLRRAIDAAGLPHRGADGSTIDWHALRHTFCTLLIQRGAAPQAVQALMGHRTIAVTMGIYADLDLAPRAEAISTLPDFDSDDSEEGASGAKKRGS